MLACLTQTIGCRLDALNQHGNGQYLEEGQVLMGEVATKLRPLADRVVIKPLAREETTRSGIVLPDTSKEKPQRGIIIAAGEGRRDDDGDRIPLDVKAGDEVLFAKYAGTEFKLDDEELLILAEKDILAIVS